MKKIVKRVVALAMVFAMCSLAVGCKSKPKVESYMSYYYETVGTTDTTSQPEGTKTSSSSKKGGTNNSSSKKNPSNSGTSADIITVDDVDLEGYKFVINSPWMGSLSETDDLYKAIKEIEKETGCKITIDTGTTTNLEGLQPLIMSGSKIADIVDIVSKNVLGLAAAGYITPWNEVKGIDVKSDYFVQGYTELGQVGNDYYGFNFTRPPEARMSVIFNKDVLESSGINVNGLYDLVKAKKWNWDTLKDYAIKVTKKHTANNQTSVWGVGGYYQKFVRALYMSNNARLADVKGGKGVTTFNSVNMKEALNFMDDLINTSKVFDATNYRNASTFDTRDNGDYKNAFSAGKLAFLFEETFYLCNYFKPANPKFNYGLVPVPMGPRATDYVTDGYNARVFVCTSTNAKSKTLDKSVAIINLLAEKLACPNGKYEGEDWWQYDTKKDYFINDADKNLEMYNIILDNHAVDYGGAVTSLQDAFLDKVVRDGIFCGNGTITANLQSLGSSYDKAVSSAFTFK